MVTLLISWKEDFELEISLKSPIKAAEKREYTGKVLNCLLRTLEFLWLPWGCRGSSVGFLRFSRYASCSLGLRFSTGMSPSKPFTRILFHQVGQKIAKRIINNEPLIYCFHSFRLLTENMHLMDI